MKRRIVAIIQARMGSSRLPGKTLADIAGQPMLVRVVERARRARTLDAIVVATTLDPLDDKIVKECHLHKYKVFRGSVADVLDRYYQAAKENQAEIIVRLCADSPLIDPGLIDEVVLAFLSADPPVDYASNRIQRTYPIGLDAEVFSLAALEKAWKEAKNKYQREHVTPFMYEPGSPCAALSVVGKETAGQYRWTVDKPEDLVLVEKIYQHFAGRDDFSWLEVVELMKKNPLLAEININVKQKDYQNHE
jgi:spore coat polysaccharide biosynthesis protein SpsF (cytidylyltransferase family)